MSLASLLKKSSLDDHQGLLKASEDALKTAKSDKQAQNVKVIALIKTDQYKPALSFFSEQKHLQDDLPEAYAYCLYKTGQFQEAAQVAEKHNSRTSQYIAVQAAYRAENYDLAVRSHAALKKNELSDEKYDMRVNQMALDALGIWTQRIPATAVPRTSTDDLASFETAYNAACISVAKGQLAEADMLLKRAINVCEHSDDLVGQDKINELIPLKAQRVFVLQSQNKTDEAQSLAKEVEQSIQESESLDMSTKTLAQNNVFTSSDIQNPFLAHKMFSNPRLGPSDKLFTNQETILNANQKTIDLKSYKVDGLSANARSTLSKSETSSLSQPQLLAGLFDAAARAQSQIDKAAINRILPEFERRPKDLGLALALIQTYVLTKNTTAAIDLLQAFFTRLASSSSQEDQDVRYSPGLVGLQIALYKSENRRTQIKQELTKAATHWRNKPEAPASLLQAAGVALLESSSREDAEQATEIFDKLYQQQPNDKATIAGYIASHATNPASNVQSLAKNLTPIEQLISSIDVDALESRGIPQSANALAIAQASQGRKRVAATSAGSKEKRVRKSKLPKNYDPNVQPDPERWLPLRDRSSYRPAKGKKKQKRDDRTQGGGNVNEALDISNRPAASEVVTASGGGGGKKKKGKGKK